LVVGAVVFAVGFLEWLIIPFLAPSIWRLAPHWNFVIMIVGIGILYETFKKKKKQC